MAVLSIREKLAILSDAAKYDASCASSGAAKRDSAKTGGIGSTEGMGICHSYAPDGRCISLLKILLTNFCIYDCSYCINRSSSNVRRARFAVDEVVKLTIAFYKRNYIEGLFLSSGVIRSPDETMAELVEVARRLWTPRRCCPANPSAPQQSWRTTRRTSPRRPESRASPVRPPPHPQATSTEPKISRRTSGCEVRDAEVRSLRRAGEAPCAFDLSVRRRAPRCRRCSSLPRHARSVRSNRTFRSPRCRGR